MSLPPDDLPLEIIDEDAERVRLEHVGQETQIKLVAALNCLAALFCGPFGVMFLIISRGHSGNPAAPGSGITLEQSMATSLRLGAGLLAFAAVNALLGYGLLTLRKWARWTYVVATVVSMIGLLVAFVAFLFIRGGGPGPALSKAGLMPGLFLLYFYWLMKSEGAGVIFTDGYRDVVRSTRHIKLEISPVFKICLGLILLFVVVLVGGGIALWMTRG